MEIKSFFYNVGDALFTKETLSINSKTYTIMYDCGCADDNLIKEAIVDGQEIDVIFLSHYHADHIRGLQKILKRAEVKRLILPMIPYPDACLAICMNMEEDEKLLWNFYIDPQSVLEKNIPITYVYGNSYLEENGSDKSDLYLSENIARNSKLIKGQSINIERDINWIYLPFNPFPYDKKKEDDFFKKLSEAVHYGEFINRSNIKEVWKDFDLQTEIREKTLELLKSLPQKPHINSTSMTLYSGPCNDVQDEFIGCLYTGDYDACTPSSINEILTFYSDYLEMIGIIQVPHHGSEYNNAALFYYPFKHKVAILSVNQKTKQISGIEKTKQLLKKLNLKMYTTDFDGNEYLDKISTIIGAKKSIKIIKRLSLVLVSFVKVNLIFIALFLSMQVYAQDLSVRSFNVDLSDQTANVKERLDLNNQPCGLIKVSLPLQNVVFEGDIIGQIEYSAGEYYVYVIDDTEMLTIKHDEFHALNLTLSEKIKSKRTYRLVIDTPSKNFYREDYSDAAVNKGNESFKKGDYIEAFILYKHLADNENNSAAQNNLGIMFEYAYGVQQNYKEAIKYYAKSAEQGNMEAQFSLGKMYYNGNGVSKDYEEAIKWFLKSAQQGSAKSQNILGNMYYNGRGVVKNYKEAIKWYRKAAELEDADGQLGLGVMYGKGNGVPKDYLEALKWFLKSAEQGNATAQCNIGNLYFSGKGVLKDYNKTFEWYYKAAIQGNAKGQGGLGILYHEGLGVAKDYFEAIKWFKKAAEQGLKEAQFALGCCYELGDGISKDYVEAIKWYKKAAEQGFSAAKERLLQLENSY